MWYTDAFHSQELTDAYDAPDADADTIGNDDSIFQHQTASKTIPVQTLDHVAMWFQLVSRLRFKKDKATAIVVFMESLSAQETDETRNKILNEFDQATWEYVTQFPVVYDSMPPMILPDNIYDYEPGHIQKLYYRSQMRQIESYCQFRDLAVIVRDERLRTGTAYDPPPNVAPLSWAEVASHM